MLRLERPGHDRQPAHVGERQTGQPVVVGPAPRAARWSRQCGRRDRLVGEDHALRVRPSTRSWRRRARRRARTSSPTRMATAQTARLDSGPEGVGPPGTPHRRRPRSAGARRRTPGRPDGRSRRGGSRGDRVGRGNPAGERLDSSQMRPERLADRHLLGAGSVREFVRTELPELRHGPIMAHT